MDSQAYVPVPPIKPQHRRMFIYFLRCPLTGALRYIGCTRDPKWRAAAHNNARCGTLTAEWVLDLRAKGLRPTFEIVEEVFGEKAAYRRESELIRTWRDEADLLNLKMLKSK